jgi:hypothetical protein
MNLDMLKLVCVLISCYFILTGWLRLSIIITQLAMDTFIENFLGIIQFSEHEIQNEKIMGIIQFS